VTFNELERRDGRLVCVISPNSVAYGAQNVKVVEDTPSLSAIDMWREGSSFQWYKILSLMEY